MDEQQYKATYQSVNPQRCVFEKAINSRVCNCAKAQRFNLADREGVACSAKANLDRCEQLISLIRKNSRFTLQRTDTSQTLAHTQEIKIQNGGLLGIQAQLNGHDQHVVEDVNELITQAEKKFSHMDNFPYTQIVQVISTYQIRKRRKSSKLRKEK